MQIKLFEEYKYIYDDNNNLIYIYEKGVLICKYTYDQDSKIIREDNRSLNTSILYKYNSSNQLKQRIYYNFTFNNLKKVKLIDKFIYDISNSNRIVLYNDEMFNYNNKGKFSLFRNAKLEYHKNAIKLDHHLFKYNFKKQRISQIIGCETTDYYFKRNKLIKQSNNEILIFHYKNNNIYGFTYNNKLYTYKKNYKNDIIGIYNENMHLICKYFYDYFGNCKAVCVLKNKLYSKLTNINPFRFKSEYFDVETGLYLIKGSIYDPETNLVLNK